MSLYLKHRPTTLDEVHGNEGTVSSLKAVLDRPIDQVPRAFLFTGPSGCGKTTLARIVAKTLGVGDGDLKEVDSADYRGIDSVREIRQQMRLQPREGTLRAYILDEVHQATKDAQSALLKALEDTPTHVVFLLATTDPQKLLPTIRNRCSTFTVQALTEEAIKTLLKKTCRAERKRVAEPALVRIATECTGSPRAALVMLDKVIGLPMEEQEAAVEAASAQEAQAIELCRALLKGANWNVLAPLIKGIQDQDAESIRRMVLGYMQSVLLGGKPNNQAALVMEAFRPPTYDMGWPAITLACYEIAEGGR